MSIHRKLLNDFNLNGTDYYLFKSLEDFDYDVEGLRGDIDIAFVNKKDEVAHKLVRDNGYRIIKFSKTGYYGLHPDIQNDRLLVIDADEYINFGRKPFKAYRLPASLFKSRQQNKHGFTEIGVLEYLQLSVITRAFAAKVKPKDLNRIIRLSKEVMLNPTRMQKISPEWRIIFEKIISGTELPKLKSLIYSTEIGKNISIDRHRLILNIFWPLIRKYRRLTALPGYRVNQRGKMISIVGIDGSGKSTLVDGLARSEILKAFGVKSMYFGNNLFLIPGLTSLKYMTRNIPIIKNIVRILVEVDRKLKILLAKYYLSRGNCVIADRYYWDEEIVYDSRHEKNSLMNRLKRRKMDFSIYPDITIFLQISGSDAFLRKQDYSKEITNWNAERYSSYFFKNQKSISNLYILDANIERSTLLKQIIKIVMAE